MTGSAVVWQKLQLVYVIIWRLPEKVKGICYNANGYVCFKYYLAVALGVYRRSYRCSDLIKD